MKKYNDNNSSSSHGIGFSGLLGIAFIVLKIIGKINWPWIWVLAPLWGPIAIAVLIIMITMLYAVFKK